MLIIYCSNIYNSVQFFCICLNILQKTGIIVSLPTKNALSNVFYYFSVIFCFENINSRNSQKRGIIKRAKISEKQNNNILQLLIISELLETLPAVCVFETKATLMIFCILRILSGVISTNASDKFSAQLKEQFVTWFLPPV